MYPSSFRRRPILHLKQFNVTRFDVRVSGTHTKRPLGLIPQTYFMIYDTEINERLHHFSGNTLSICNIIS